MNYFSVDEASKYTISALTLVGLDRICFNGIPDRSIEFYMDFCERFTTHFTSRKRRPMTVHALSGIIHGKKERLQFHIDQFIQVVVEVDRYEEGLKCWIFENNLLRDLPFRLNLERK